MDITLNLYTSTILIIPFSILKKTYILSFPNKKLFNILYEYCILLTSYELCILLQ